MDETQDDTEGSSAGKASSLAAGTSSSVAASAGGLGGAGGAGSSGGGVHDSGALTSKSVEALSKQLEVCYKGREPVFNYRVICCNKLCLYICSAL